jgi:hypothetical protein
MKTIVLLLAANSVLSGPVVTCKLEISYPQNDPQQITFRVPDKQCDIEGMQKALAMTLFLLQR